MKNTIDSSRLVNDSFVSVGESTVIGHSHFIQKYIFCLCSFMQHFAIHTFKVQVNFLFSSALPTSTSFTEQYDITRESCGIGSRQKVRRQEFR